MSDSLPPLALLEQGALQLDQEINSLVEQCLASLSDAQALRTGVDALGRLPGPRAEFVLCVFSLELARLGEVEARERFSQHAGVLLEAHRSPDLARYLLASHPQMTERWKRLEPLLEEFDRSRASLATSGNVPSSSPSERKAVVDAPSATPVALRAESVEAPSGPVDPIPAAIDRCWAARGQLESLQAAMADLAPLGDRRVEFALCLFSLELSRLGLPDARRDFASRAALLLEAYHQGAVADDLIGSSSALRALWTDLVPYLEEFFELAAPPIASDEELAIEEEVEAEEVQELALDDLEVVEEVDRPARLPPPPPSKTPLPGKIPAYPAGTRRPSSVMRPPPPPVTGDFPSEETRRFWDHTDKALNLLPGEDGLLSGARAFSVQTKEERVKLHHFALEILERFPRAPPARALSCLLQLYLATQMKERTLFGKPNASRQEAVGAGLALLTGDAVAAGHAAAFFDNDGNETRHAFSAVIDVVMGFLAWCMKNQLDPMATEAVNRYISL